MPASSRYRITPGTPPTSWRSSITYCPDGFRSASSGTRALVASQSSRFSSSSNARAIAIMCNTALVDPPSAMVTTIAFSSDSRVTIRRGVKPSDSNISIIAPADTHSSTLAGSSAGVHDEYGRLKPIASMAVAIVFAVYIPPHAPAPGMAHDTIVCLSSSVIVPARNCP